MASFRPCITILVSIFVSILILGSACKTENPYYCKGAPYDNCTFEAGVPIPCLAACLGATPACDMDQGKCVQCTVTEHAACVGIKPVCRNTMCQACSTQQECGSLACLPDGRCDRCTKHTDCMSLACLPGGSCADPGQVAYVQSGASGPQPCAKDAPCGTLQEGIDAVNTSIPYIKVSSMGGVLTPNATTTINGKAVIILADPGATLARTGSGVNLEVSNGDADVQIYDLEISGASDVGISIPKGGMPKLALTRVRVASNMAGGISATSGIVTVSQSTITGNLGLGIAMDGGTLRVSQSTISSNSKGGISVSGTGATFDITNCFIFRNGDDTDASIGGLSLTGGSAGTSVFSFNTVVDNRIRNTDVSAGGVLCDIPSFAASNNIIARNFRNNMSNQSNSNTLGQCQHLTSTIVSNTSAVSGLKFVLPDNAPYNYHLKQGSSAIDQATTPSTLGFDFDGDSRPQGGGRDQGADEVP